jgi:hypothetical protein
MFPFSALPAIISAVGGVAVIGKATTSGLNHVIVTAMQA